MCCASSRTPCRVAWACSMSMQHQSAAPLCRTVAGQKFSLQSFGAVRTPLQCVVALGNEKQHAQDRHVEAKGCLLAVPLLRLPHLEPLPANHHETEEPDEEAQGGADIDETLASLEAVAICAKIAGHLRRACCEGETSQAL